ncbi:hypothetical protein QQP08_011598 [Theobroma cacao]|uniref:Uncharacterized protein n=1 Tax=Theobroma cacao TaxID=3641 RepID=A0A061G0H4_THECC|nr:Uncharacterized protein TCM_014932 [Theobroma cacao]WRX19111.1 hypothetical protein QQP08_011598 [Theobroma cacao]
MKSGDKSLELFHGKNENRATLFPLALNPPLVFFSFLTLLTYGHVSSIMSITLSFLLIFFSCLSMHACNARHLRVMDDKALAPHQKLQFSTKALESVELNRDDQISVREGSSGESHHATATVVKPKDSDNLLKETKQNREMSSSVPVPIKPLVSFSGRVPRKNYDERTGFFSDYSRPRTRPPSHN